MPVELDGADEISRCIIYDRAFEADAHVDSHLWRFENSSPDGVYHESAVLRRLAPTEDDVHQIGCGIAQRQNERKQQPEPGPKRRYYCGFRTATLISLPRQGDGYSVEFTNLPEDGEEAHIDVALIITVEGKSARAVRRTDAGLALAEQFGPPAPHVCECDLNDGHHPINAWGEQCLCKELTQQWSSVRLDGPVADAPMLGLLPHLPSPAND